MLELHNEKISDLNKNKLITIRKELNEIFHLGYIIFANLHTDKKDKLIRFCYNIFYRNLVCLESVRTLLRDYESGTKITENSIKIILRASLLDYLLLLYVLSFKKENGKNTSEIIFEKIDEIQSEQIKYFFKMLKYDKENAKVQNEKKINLIELIIEKNKSLFNIKDNKIDYNKPEKYLIYKNNISIKTIKNRLDSLNPKGKHIGACHFYDEFSKVDHLGDIGVMFSLFSPDINFMSFHLALIEVLEGLNVCLFYLSKPIIANEIQKIRSNIGHIKGIRDTTTRIISKKYIEEEKQSTLYELELLNRIKKQELIINKLKTEIERLKINDC